MSVDTVLDRSGNVRDIQEVLPNSEFRFNAEEHMTAEDWNSLKLLIRSSEGIPKYLAYSMITFPQRFESLKSEVQSHYERSFSSVFSSKDRVWKLIENKFDFEITHANSQRQNNENNHVDWYGMLHFLPGARQLYPEKTDELISKKLTEQDISEMLRRPARFIKPNETSSTFILQAFEAKMAFPERVQAFEQFSEESKEQVRNLIKSRLDFHQYTERIDTFIQYAAKIKALFPDVDIKLPQNLNSMIDERLEYLRGVGSYAGFLELMYFATILSSNKAEITKKGLVLDRSQKAHVLAGPSVPEIERFQE